MHYREKQRGFTIVELLVVIVVIGILAAITIVSYTGISQKAVTAALQSDLTNASNQLKLYQVTNGAYPTSLDGNNCFVPIGVDNVSVCLKPSGTNSLTYQTDGTASPQTFSLINSNGTTYYRITSDSTITQVATVCPYNFIVVPGSVTYGTSTFCVMKYEAKQVGATTVPISQAAGTPWTSIMQTTAATNASNVVGCTGCHLITEAEWLTIAQNLLSVPSNWSGGVVGSGYMYSGHNDSAPSNSLTADTSDSNGYSGTGNSSLSGPNQRRTLTLTNGEVIWDIAGNVYEWTQGTTTGNQPGVSGGGFAYREWNAITTHGTLSPDPFPSYGTPAASGWTVSQGIGSAYSNSDDATLRGFVRGGRWVNSTNAGVLALHLNSAPTSVSSDLGFRISR